MRAHMLSLALTAAVKTRRTLIPVAFSSFWYTLMYLYIYI